MSTSNEQSNANTTAQPDPIPKVDEFFIDAKKFMTLFLERFVKTEPPTLPQTPEELESFEPVPLPRTAMGSPCARSWDEDWIAEVDDAEARLERHICGAHTLAGIPCELAPDHENGRCRFHGGFDLTGGAQGNRNAVIHALYSRRLRICDRRCPLRAHCPCAGEDVDALPASRKPICPYEQTEYNTTLTDALSRAATNPTPDPLSLHIAHNVALLQVMLSRAAVALRDDPIAFPPVPVDAPEDAPEPPKAAANAPRHSPKLIAFQRLAAEYRRFAALLQPKQPAGPSVIEHLSRTCRTLGDTSLEPDRQKFFLADVSESGDETQQHLREAIECIFDNDDLGMLEALYAAANAPIKQPYLYQRPRDNKLDVSIGELSEGALMIFLDVINERFKRAIAPWDYPGSWKYAAEDAKKAEEEAAKKAVEEEAKKTGKRTPPR